MGRETRDVRRDICGAPRALYQSVFSTHAAFPWVVTHGCVISPLRGSVWFVRVPWVSLRSTHGCVISPLMRFYVIALQ